MKVVAFLEPPQGAAIEKILRHCGLWHPSTSHAPPPEDGRGYEPCADGDSQPIPAEQSGELTFVEIDEFLATEATGSDHCRNARILMPRSAHSDCHR